MFSLPSNRPFGHFALLMFIFAFAVATLPCWAIRPFVWVDAASVLAGAVVAYSLLPLYSKWAESDLYWKFRLTRWADYIGILTCLVQLGALVYGAWWVSGLAWFHLSAKEHFIFVLVLLILSALWFIEAVIDLIQTEIDIRRIMRVPADLLPKRGGWHE
jgi:hypothetical protein